MNDLIEIKEITVEEASTLIETRQPKGLFYTTEKNGIIVGIDNSTGDAWTDEFENLDKCKDWLQIKPINVEEA